MTTSKVFQGPSPHSSSSSDALPGTVYAVGNKELYNETGTGCIPELTYPCYIKELDLQPIVDIASGRYHTLALHRNGKLYSWGCNDYGALGRPGEEMAPVMIENVSLRNVKFSKIACGDTMSMAISEENVLYTWGTLFISDYSPTIKKRKQEIPHIMTTLSSVDIVDIAAGAVHCLALSSKGHVYSWGSDEYSQLGRREAIKDVETLDPPPPVNESRRLLPTRIGGLDDIVAIACGAYHSFAVNRYGQMFSWGSNKFQQCGLVREKALGDDEEIPKDIIYRPTLMPYFRYANQDYHSGFLQGAAAGRGARGIIGEQRQNLKVIEIEEAVVVEKTAEKATTFLLQSKAKLMAKETVAAATANKAVLDKSKCTTNDNVEVPTFSIQEEKENVSQEKTSLRKVEVKKATSVSIVNKEKVTHQATPSSIAVAPSPPIINNADDSDSSCHHKANNSGEGGPKIKSVSCGEYHTIVLMSDNCLVVFGRCDGGQLGEMFYTHFPYTGAVKSKQNGTLCALGLPLKNLWHCDYEIKKVVCGANRNIVITQTGETYGFGRANHSQSDIYAKLDVVAFPTLLNYIKNIGKVVNASAGDHFSTFIVA